jgi:hypothetical protein
MRPSLTHWFHYLCSHNLDLTWIELSTVLCFQCVFYVSHTYIDASLGLRWRRDKSFSHFFLKYMVANMPRSRLYRSFILGMSSPSGRLFVFVSWWQRLSKTSTPFSLHLHATRVKVKTLRSRRLYDTTTIRDSDSKHEPIDTRRQARQSSPSFPPVSTCPPFRAWDAFVRPNPTRIHLSKSSNKPERSPSTDRRD